MNDSAKKLPENAIRTTLERILTSKTFVNAGRLRAFLTYVVEEELAGRAHLIAGKTIAQDVYGRAPDEGSDSIVRVDAGRLRRKLSDYYKEEGSAISIRIFIDSGGYAPRFETIRPDETNAPQGEDRKVANGPTRSYLKLDFVAAIALALAVLAGVMLTFREAPNPVTPPTDHTVRNQQERTALAEKSTATLQAANLAEQASGMLFPIADIEHQKLATAVYREAIRIDPSFSDGFAGAAHSLGTLALLAPTADLRAALLNEAEDFADRAIDLNPRSGWSQSAAAWVAFAKGDYDQAIRQSRTAASLNPLDGKTLDFHGVILGVTGHFQESAQASDPEVPRNNRGRHPAHLNIYGVANFHLGNYELAIASFDEAILGGGPVSELTLMYKAASHQALGDTSTARALLKEMQTTWPAFRPDAAVMRFYQHPEHAEQILTELRAAGWSAGK